MYPAKEITDQVFGRLTALYPSKLPGKKKWLCQCECGKFIRVLTSRLILGGTKSCGCLIADVLKTRNKTHGQSRTLAHISWCAMKTRCYNPRVEGYTNYGGRGIKVCERWLHSFENFLEDMGPRESTSLSIERVNNDGNYEPGNCIWATRKVQNWNSRNCHYIKTPLGTMSLSEACEKFNIKRCTMKRRLRAGYYGADLLKPSLRSCR